jgi:hypothetical protein
MVMSLAWSLEIWMVARRFFRFVLVRLRRSDQGLDLVHEAPRSVQIVLDRIHRRQLRPQHLRNDAMSRKSSSINTGFFSLSLS